MAELDVQPKKKSILPWILIGLIVLALIAYFLLRNTNLADDVSGESIFSDSADRARQDSINANMDTTTSYGDTTTLR